MTLITQTFKDAALEDSIALFQAQLGALGFTIEEASLLNPVPHVWSVRIHDRDCPLCFTNGKGATRKAALGEYFERLSTNYFFADFFISAPRSLAASLCIIPTSAGSRFRPTAGCRTASWTVI